METLFTPTELKFSAEPSSGIFEGYGSIFGNEDSHRDVVLPGCFGPTLTEHKSRGTMPALFVEHSAFTPGGDPLPVGRWLDMVEDSKGLHCRGKLSAPDTEHARRIRGLMEDGALPGLSIAFTVPEGGAIYGKSKGEPKRQLKQVNLYAVDIVRSPSNPLAGIHSLKATMLLADHQLAGDAIRNAIQLASACMAGGDSPNAEERSALMEHLQSAHKAIFGEHFVPPTQLRHIQLRQLKNWLHLPVDQGGLGYSAKQADEIACLVFKSNASRDESSGDAMAATRAAIAELRSQLAGFSLPK
jgi:HK97 family phage prohead protease